MSYFVLFSCSEQTQLLVQKMMVLEQKLKSMESQLKDVSVVLFACVLLVVGIIVHWTMPVINKSIITNTILCSLQEQIQRLTLEAKVVKLEEDNQKLIARREMAGQQLQDFAEKFFAASDAISIKGSPAPSPRPSPYPSLTDLNILMRRGSRADSVSSSRRSSQSRLSGISL